MAKVQLYITSNALAAVAVGTTTAQINVRGLEHKGGSNKNPLTLTVDLKVGGTVRPVQFILRDTNGIHPSHQTGEALEIWGRLYDALSKTPGRPLIPDQTEISLWILMVIVPTLRGWYERGNSLVR